MRKDFGRLVIEHERSGSHNRGLKIRKTGSFRLDSADWQEWDYDGPLKIRTGGVYGIKHAYDKGLGEKEFSDVLRPVYGYLNKSIGRQWDDVYSELTQALGRGTWPVRHVLESHTLHEVSRNTYVENGKVYSQPERYSYGKYFVDPRDGTLRKEKEGPRYRYKLPVYDRHHWKDGLWFVRINGVWYLGCYTSNAALATDLPRGPSPASSEVSRRRMGFDVDRDNRSWFWPNIAGLTLHSSKSYFVKWHQAGKRDLKALRKMLTP